MKKAANEQIYHMAQSDGAREVLQIRLCGVTLPDRDYEISRESSAVACIEYVEEGAGTLEIDGRVFHPEAGDSYFLQVGTRHHYYSDRKDPWKKVFISVSGKLIESLTEGYGLKNIYYFRGLDLSGELYAVLQAAKADGQDGTQEVICLLNRALFKMRQHVRETGRECELAEKMKEYLRANAGTRFRIEELCRHVSRSESQVFKTFRAAYGTTPYAYFLAEKLRLAKDMLLYTGLSAKQIAHELCFADEYYFSNLFRQKTGMSPTMYRKRAAGMTRPPEGHK